MSLKLARRVGARWRRRRATVDLYDKAGVIHVHTRYSDGEGTVAAVARAAVRAKAQFVIVTDHDSLAGQQNGEEGWYERRGRLVERGGQHDGQTLVFFGYEISPDDGNHFLALGLSEVVSKEQPPAAYVREVARRGGVGFIAHPDYPPSREYPLKPFPWTDWNVTGYTGLEIWSYSVDWLTGVTTVPRLLASLVFPDRFTDGPMPETLARWDDLCRAAWRRGRKVVGIGGTDAHGILYSYRRMFQTVRTHVLLERDWSGDAVQDKQAVLAALRQGAAYVAYDRLYDATGFRFTAETNVESAVMGGTLSRARRSGARRSVWLRAQAPTRCMLTLRTPDGVVQQVDGNRLEARVEESGVYRMEAHIPSSRGLRPWVFTNPIYVR